MYSRVLSGLAPRGLVHINMYVQGILYEKAWPCILLLLIIIISSYRVFFFRKVPLRKVLSIELVPLNRIKSPSTLVPPKATTGAKNNQNRRFLTLQCSDAVQWYPNIALSFHYFFSYKHATQVTQSFLPSKTPPPTAMQA